MLSCIKGQTYTASNVANYANIYSTGTAIPLAKAVDFSKSKGISQARETSVYETNATLVGQIDAGYPFLIGSRQLESLFLSGHAMAVLGYRFTTTTTVEWTIWDCHHSNYTLVGNSRCYNFRYANVNANFIAWTNYILFS